MRLGRQTTSKMTNNQTCHSCCEQVRDELDRLRKQNESLLWRIRDIEAYQRKFSLILSGAAIPAYSPYENLEKIIIELIKQQLKILIPEYAVSAVQCAPVKSK